MMNTYSSIIASVVATFAVSALSNKEGKLFIDHINEVTVVIISCEIVVLQS